MVAAIPQNSGGTGFWHETYFRHGDMEAIYDDVPDRIGFAAFAPVVTARGPMFGAAQRAARPSPGEAVIREEDLY